MSTIKINIVSSSEEIYSGEATMVYATGTLGELGIAPGHTPLLTGLAAGPVRVQNGSEEDKELVARARKAQRFLSQPFFVAEIFTGTPGKYVSLEDTIKAFKGILNGDYDHLPEQAFYMVGTIEEAVEKAKTL